MAAIPLFKGNMVFGGLLVVHISIEDHNGAAHSPPTRSSMRNESTTTYVVCYYDSFGQGGGEIIEL